MKGAVSCSPKLRSRIGRSFVREVRFTSPAALGMWDAAAIAMLGYPASAL